MAELPPGRCCSLFCRVELAGRTLHEGNSCGSLEYVSLRMKIVRGNGRERERETVKWSVRMRRKDKLPAGREDAGWRGRGKGGELFQVENT